MRHSLVKGDPPLGYAFLTVWAGQALSTLGSMLSGVGTGVWVFLETGSTAWLGALTALSGAPAVALAPLLGRIDRYRRRTVMIVGDTIAMIASAIALALGATGRLQVWHLGVVALVGGAGSAIQAPAFAAAIPALVDRSAIDRANGLNQFGPALAMTAGPILAAPMVAWWGLEAVLWADLASFAVAIGALLAVRFADHVTVAADADSDPMVDPSPVTADSPAHFETAGAARSEWRPVLAWFAGPGRALAGLLATIAVVNLVMAGFSVALLALAVELGGAGGAGVPLAAGGAAMIVGSIVIGARGLPARRVRAFVVGLASLALGTTIAASRPTMALLVVGVVLAFVSVPAVNAAMASTFHDHVPPRLQGRVFALSAGIAQSLGPVGAIVTGAAISVICRPAMAPHGWAGSTIGRVIGTGPDRAPALALLAIAFAISATAVHLARSSVVTSLDAVPASEERTRVDRSTDTASHLDPR